MAKKSVVTIIREAEKDRKYIDFKKKEKQAHCLTSCLPFILQILISFLFDSHVLFYTLQKRKEIRNMAIYCTHALLVIYCTSTFLCTKKRQFVAQQQAMHPFIKGRKCYHVCPDGAHLAVEHLVSCNDV